MKWENSKFDFPKDALSCDGNQLIHFDEKYKLYVGLTFCNQFDEFRLYLSTDRDKSFLPAADTGGHGQDHCELINPNFTLPNTDNINSGGCKACATSRNLPLEYVDVWSRSNLGQPFKKIHTGSWSNQTSRLKCGVSFENCFLPNKPNDNFSCYAKLIEDFTKAEEVSKQKIITIPTEQKSSGKIINYETNQASKTNEISSQGLNKNNGRVLPRHKHKELLNEAAKNIGKNEKITKSNIKDFKEYLTDSQIKLLETNKDFYLDISNNFSSFSPLLKTEFIPYPEPKTGSEMIWNHLLRFRGQEWERTTNSFAYYSDGNTSERYVAREEYLFKYKGPSDPIYQRAMTQVTEPARSKGEIIVKHVFREDSETGFEAWQYLPGTRRVRKAPTLGYDFPAPPDRIKTLDMEDIFSGPLSKYNWKLVGKKEIYVPVIDRPEPLRSESNKSLADFTPHQRKEVWVVEATLKPDNKHSFHRRIYYIDPNSWNIMLAEHYDSEGELVKFSMAKVQYYPDHQSLIPDYELHYDYTNAAYVIDQHWGYKFYLSGHYPENYFTVQQIRKGGCKR